jgi:hypothetical protein
LTKNWPDLFQQHAKPPESLDEAIDRLMTILDDVQKAAIVAMREEYLIDLHFGLGMAIRNAFGLHEPGSQLLASCGVAHPDDASEVIIRELWLQLITESFKQNG